ncbi:hypothetical protein D3C81_1038850 [compost metagenome]
MGMFDCTELYRIRIVITEGGQIHAQRELRLHGQNVIQRIEGERLPDNFLAIRIAGLLGASTVVLDQSPAHIVGELFVAQ